MSSPTDDSLTNNVALPKSLDGQLRGFRRRLRVLKLVEVVLAAIAGLMFAYLVVFIVERWVAIPSLIRTVILIAGTVGFSVALPLALRKWYWNTRRLEQVARILRIAFPVLGDEILSVIEMADRRTGQGASPRLVAAATEQTSSRVAKKDLSIAAPARLARRRGLIAVTLVAAAIGLMVIVPAAAGNSWLRLLNPWTNVPRFTFAKIGNLPTEKVVPYGESFQLVVPLAEESQWKPDSANAKIGPSTVAADLEGDAYRFSMPAQTTDVKLNVKVGDNGRSLDVLPMTRPELNSINYKTLLPEYLQYPKPIEETTISRRFNVLVGSQIQFDFLASREIAGASLDGQPIHANGQYVSTGGLLIDRSRQHTVNWRDIYELQPRKPIELAINVIKDQEPAITFENIKERVLLESKALRFKFNSYDDFGIKKIGLEWTGQPTADGTGPIHGEKLLFAGNPQNRAINEQGIFTPKLENVSPQVLTLRLFVEDYLPNRKRAYSRPQTIRVMSPDEHVGWLHAKMQRWKSAADAVYEREVALAEENKNLRRLDSEERRTEDNIRRMGNQAAAERDNSQRLKRTVDQGRELIQQALANENLRSQQVEQWAQSLAKLQKIAERDMPGIADQLNEVLQDMKNESQSKSNDGGKDSKSGAGNGESSPSESGENPTPESGQNSPPSEGESGAQNPPSGGGVNPPQGGGRNQPPGDQKNERKQGENNSPENRDNNSPKTGDDNDPSEDMNESNSKGNTGQPSDGEPSEQAPKAGENRLELNPGEKEPGEEEGENDDENGEDEEPSEKSPSLQDVEDSMIDREQEGSGDQTPDAGGQGSPSLDLPSTDLLNPEQEIEKEEQEQQEDQERRDPVPSLDGIVEDHEKLLEEFKKAREAMNEVMAEFENSTFVKRFKSASRRQLELASQLNQLLPDSFGSRETEHEQAKQKLAELSSYQQSLFEDLQGLNTDLKAYHARAPADSRQAILDEMDSLKMQVKLGELPQRLMKNRLGDSLHRSEFWADTFDRWGEELVPPARPPSPSNSDNSNGPDPSLPPAIVLEVMRQIEAEMNLRDETRVFEQSRAAMDEQERRERNDGLTVYQMSVQERSLDTIEDIKRLPGGEKTFRDQLGKLTNAASAMNDATGMLFDYTTGDPAIAAETAAIEALLESRRIEPPPSNPPPPQGSSSQDGSESLAGNRAAMDMFNPAEGQFGQPQARGVGAGTSASSDNVPERFRSGVDNFTNQLGRLRSRKQ